MAKPELPLADFSLANRKVFFNEVCHDLVLAKGDGNCMYYALAYRINLHLKYNKEIRQSLAAGPIPKLGDEKYHLNEKDLRKLLSDMYNELAEAREREVRSDPIAATLRADAKAAQGSTYWGSLMDATNLAGLFGLDFRLVNIKAGRLRLVPIDDEFFAPFSWKNYSASSLNGYSGPNVYHHLLYLLNIHPSWYPSAPYFPLLRYIADYIVKKKDDPLGDIVKAGFFNDKANIQRCNPTFKGYAILWYTGTTMESAIGVNQNHYNLFVDHPIHKSASVKLYDYQHESHWTPHVFELLGVGPFQVHKECQITSGYETLNNLKILFESTDLDIKDFAVPANKYYQRWFSSQDAYDYHCDLLHNIYAIAAEKNVDFILYMMKPGQFISTNIEYAEESDPRTHSSIFSPPVQYSLLNSNASCVRRPRYKTYFILVDDRDSIISNQILWSRRLALCKLACFPPPIKHYPAIQQYPVLTHPSVDAAYKEFMSESAKLAGDVTSDISLITPFNIMRSLYFRSWFSHSYRHHVDFLASLLFKSDPKLTATTTPSPPSDALIGFGFVDYERMIPFTCRRDTWYWNNVDYLLPGSIHETARLELVGDGDGASRHITIEDAPKQTLHEWFAAVVDPKMSQKKVTFPSKPLAPILSTDWLQQFHCLADVTVAIRSILATQPELLLDDPAFVSDLLQIHRLPANSMSSSHSASSVRNKIDANVFALNIQNVRYSLLPYMRVFYRLLGCTFNVERCESHEVVVNEHWFAPFSQNPSHELRKMKDEETRLLDRTRTANLLTILQNLGKILLYYGLLEDYMELMAIKPRSLNHPNKIRDLIDSIMPINIGGDIPNVTDSGFQTEIRYNHADASGNVLCVTHSMKEISSRGEDADGEGSASLVYHEIKMTPEGKAQLIGYLTKDKTSGSVSFKHSRAATETSWLKDKKLGACYPHAMLYHDNGDSEKRAKLLDRHINAQYAYGFDGGRSNASRVCVIEYIDAANGNSAIFASTEPKPSALTKLMIVAASKQLINLNGWKKKKADGTLVDVNLMVPYVNKDNSTMWKKAFATDTVHPTTLNVKLEMINATQITPKSGSMTRYEAKDYTKYFPKS